MGYFKFFNGVTKYGLTPMANWDFITLGELTHDRYNIVEDTYISLITFLSMFPSEMVVMVLDITIITLLNNVEHNMLKITAANYEMYEEELTIHDGLVRISWINFLPHESI
jgi:hypothetical protein